MGERSRRRHGELAAKEMESETGESSQMRRAQNGEGKDKHTKPGETEGKVKETM